MAVTMVTILALMLGIVWLHIVTALNLGAFQPLIDKHNFGYVLKFKREVHIANYNAKLVFHLKIPSPDMTFDDGQYDCRFNVSTARPCVQMRPILRTAAIIRRKTQIHVQMLLKHVNEVIEDLPLAGQRTRRGLGASILSRITGLATEEDLESVINLLERIEQGIYEASEIWGDGARNLVAAFEVEQKRMDNVYDILRYYRQTLRDMQLEMIRTRTDHSDFTLMAKLLTWLTNITFQVAEIEALYTGVQILLGGKISHFLLPHSTLTSALKQIESRLDQIQPHMILARRDNSYFYVHAPFKAFRAGQILVLIVDVPIAMEAFMHPFNLYEVIHLPLPTPESNNYFSVLATDIKFVGFCHDADIIFQLTGDSTIPHFDVWLASQIDAVFLDRKRLTCAKALVEGVLLDIKNACRYNVHKAPIPRGLIRLFHNSFLVTNISQIHMHCLAHGSDNEFLDKTIILTDIQTIHTFDCHCQIFADEFVIIADLTTCNMTENVTSLSDVQYPINLAFLSEFFDEDQLANISADSLLNHSVKVYAPDLLIADKILDEKFGLESAARFDMQAVINNTKQSVNVYDDLSHFLFNEMVKAHTAQGHMDLLSWYTWVTIFSWIASIIAIILVVRFNFKVKSLSLLLMARSTKAAPIPEIPRILAVTTTTSTPSPPLDILREWLFHTDIVSKVVPLEILILLCLVFLFLFKLARMIYNRRRRITARTILVLEVGNAQDSITLPVVELMHSPICYRFVINKAEINLHMIQKNFSGELLWSKGILFNNSALDLPIVLPESLRVRFWQVKRLKSLLNGPFFAAIQVLSGDSFELRELVVLRSFVTNQQSQQLYPALSAMP